MPIPIRCRTPTRRSAARKYRSHPYSRHHPPLPVPTKGRTRPAGPLEEEEVTTREAILKALEEAD